MRKGREPERAKSLQKSILATPDVAAHYHDVVCSASEVGNRNPETDEIAACEQFLFRQIGAVKPKIICALGTFGAQTLLRTTESIGRLRGRLIDYRGVKLLATFHPAYLLRNPNEKRKVWEDMLVIRKYLDSLH